MKIVVFGLDFRTASVEVRERLTLSGYALQVALEELRGMTVSSPAGQESPGRLDEIVILSTCNRLEVYASAQEEGGAFALIARYLADLCGMPVAEMRTRAYARAQDDAVHHLMRVACGLDSMILGESQILGQVTQAFEDAHAEGATGPLLSHLFAQAIHAGKRARTESPISRYTTSVSHAAALRIMEQVADPPSAHILVVGAGESAVLAAQALRRLGMSHLSFINRTFDHADALAESYGGSALTWYQLDEALVWADAVICATGAPHIVIYRQDVETILGQRDARPLVFVDIAVPRDVEDSVRDLAGVRYSDIDDLQFVVDANLELRRAVVPQVEAIIAVEMLRFAEWHRGRQVLPVIRDLREWAQEVAREELEQTLNRLPEADERTRQVVSRLANQLVNRLLHEPTTRLRMQALEGNGHGYAYALRELFALRNSGEAHSLCDEAECPIVAHTNGTAVQCNLECIVPAMTEPNA